MYTFQDMAEEINDGHDKEQGKCQPELPLVQDEQTIGEVAVEERDECQEENDERRCSYFLFH